MNNKNTLAIVFALFFILTTVNVITDNKAPRQQEPSIYNIDINDLTIINISSTNEKIAWLASFAACDKHLSNKTKEARNACALDLVAIAHQENRDFSHNTRGSDSFQSHGLFQISRYYHKHVTIDQANDPYFSADWTLARLINNGYLTSNRDNSIMRHNGTPNIPATIRYLAGINNYILLINNN